jgi:hypothetical protein
MATTAIFPIHTGRGRSVARALKEVTDYMENPLKTDGGELISSYECNPETADLEFNLAKRLTLTSRSGRIRGTPSSPITRGNRLSPERLRRRRRTA